MAHSIELRLDLLSRRGFRQAQGLIMIGAFCSSTGGSMEMAEANESRLGRRSHTVGCRKHASMSLVTGQGKRPGFQQSDARLDDRSRATPPRCEGHLDVS